MFNGGLLHGFNDRCFLDCCNLLDYGGLFLHHGSGWDDIGVLRHQLIQQLLLPMAHFGVLPLDIGNRRSQQEEYHNSGGDSHCVTNPRHADGTGWGSSLLNFRFCRFHRSSVCLFLRSNGDHDSIGWCDFNDFPMVSQALE